MRRSRSWIHVLLSFALTFNGLAAAQASTRMLLQHAGAGSTSTDAQARGPETASQVPPCHAGTAEPTTEVAAVSYSQPGATGDSGNTPDCCKGGTCRCHCVHQSQGVIAIELLAEPALANANSVRAMKPAHPEASLPNLIRPPIG